MVEPSFAHFLARFIFFVSPFWVKHFSLPFFAFCCLFLLVRYVVDYKKRRAIKDRLFTRILEEFDKTSGRVEIASMTVHLVQAPVFDVRIRERLTEPAA